MIFFILCLVSSKLLSKAKYNDNDVINTDVQLTVNEEGDLIVSNNYCNITLSQKIGGAVVNNFIPADSKIPEFANIATTIITQCIIGFLVVRGITGQDIITP